MNYEELLRSAVRYCIRGHPLAGKNLIIRKDGTRRCAICHSWRNAARNRKKSNGRDGS